jgi:alanyl-tRNA synthetase
MSFDDAVKHGAMALFGEKYGDEVRVMDIGSSKELCGGVHVHRTGDIGLFKITSDRSLAAGVRRMEALTGRGALAYFQTIEDAAHELQQQLNVRLEDVPAQLRTMQERQKALEKELKQLKLKAASGGATASTSSADESVDVDGVKLIARRIDDVNGGDLRNLADTFRSKLKSGVVVLGSATDGKVTLLTAVTKDLLDRVNANALINKLAPIVGGKGGGKPDLAQAGGKDPDKLNEAIEHAPQALREVLAG